MVCADGQLTAGEASNLEKKESQLNQEERDMKAEDNGHLTSADKAPPATSSRTSFPTRSIKDNHNSRCAEPGPEEQGRPEGRKPAGSH